MLCPGGFTYRINNLKRDNSPTLFKFTWPYKDVFVDVDGSMTGAANSTVTEYTVANTQPECVRGDAGVYDGGLICNSSVSVRRVAH